MNGVRFQARNAADAIGQIHSQLGAEAVVLSVMRLPVTGIRRLWCKPRLEVVAGLPEVEDHGQSSEVPASCAASSNTTQAEFPSGVPDREKAAAFEDWRAPVAAPNCASLQSTWRTAALLRQMGLEPLCVDQVIERVRASHGDEPPVSFAHEFALVRAALTSLWRPPPRASAGLPPIHVFAGPPGSGKTTALCKWLAKSVLAEQQTARAWRLDSGGANFAGLLDVYGEILGVPVEREWRGCQTSGGFDAGFVDLPGTDLRDSEAVKRLRAQVEAIPGAQVHLVLNAAYDLPVLLAQARAFAALPVNDLIFSHVDEEKRLGKLWNFVLGTNFTIRCLSGGQNIPGEFCAAAPELLFPK
jgi:flagellar biosynthesis protein FlhF